MILNFVLLFLVFGAAKKKYNPYVSSLILGAVKGALYFISSRNVIVSVVAFLIFSGLAAGIVYFLARIDKKEATEEPYPKYGSRKKSVFKWEYIPVSGFVLFLIFGEMIVPMMLL